MGDDDERDGGSDLARLSVIQTVFVAALALHVEYTGPIGAGDNADQDPTWRPYRHDEEAGESLLVDLRTV